MLAIFIVVAYGLMPLCSVFFVSSREAWLVGFKNLPLNGSVLMLYSSDGSADIVLISVSLFLCVFSAASAIWAYSGDSAGRIAALAFVSADVLWWSAIVIYAIASADVDGSARMNWIFELVGPPIWLGFIWWNFTRPDVNAYYRFKSETAK